MLIGEDSLSRIKMFTRRIVPRSLWNRLRLLRMQQSLRRYHPRQVKHVYGGYLLDIWLADPLGEGWYDHDWPELSEIALLKQHRLKPGGKVFNIGAHQCVVALMLAQIVGQTGLVVAVEASSHNAAVAKRNRDLNKIKQLEVLNAAVAAHSRTLIFNQGLNGQVDDGTGEWGECLLRAVSVDNLMTDYGVPDVLFIDVEGYELNVLRGARNTLIQRPDCFIEVHVGCGLERFQGSAQEVLSFFPGDSYDLYVASEDQRTFTQFTSGMSTPSSRFFLVGIARGAPVRNR
jgi:FkbM family methyltransferase